MSPSLWLYARISSAYDKVHTVYPMPGMYILKCTVVTDEPFSKPELTNILIFEYYVPTLISLKAEDIKQTKRR